MLFEDVFQSLIDSKVNLKKFDELPELSSKTSSMKSMEKRSPKITQFNINFIKVEDEIEAI